MTLDEIIYSHEEALKLFGDSFSEGKYKIEIILTLAKEIKGLKDSLASLDSRTLGLMTFGGKP